MQLTDEQAQARKALSAGTALSISELVRRGVDPFLRKAVSDQEERVGRALGIVGRFHSARSDISAEHDRYGAEP